jgi:chorismate lyase
VTRHLHLLTGAPVAVDVLDMRILGDAEVARLPPAAREIAGPILQRRVLLRAGGSVNGDSKTPPLVFATSWWNVADASATLAAVSRPIWASLADGRSELFREIRGVEHGCNPALARAFGLGCEGSGGEGSSEDGGLPALWGRHYLFHRGGRPLTAIYEVFSPRLGDWLGVEGGGTVGGM